MSGQGPKLGAEPLEAWQYAGLDCAIVPNRHMGLFNGYVRLPEGHPGRAGSSGDLDVDVHGGLTYGPDDDGWVGFDTAHLGDFWAPDDLMGYLDEQSARYFGVGGIGRYAARGEDPFARQWTIPQLRAEVERLAEQCAQIGVDQ